MHVCCWCLNMTRINEPGQNGSNFQGSFYVGFNQLTFALTHMECDLENCVQTLQKRILLFFLNSQMAANFHLVAKTEKRKLSKENIKKEN